MASTKPDFQKGRQFLLEYKECVKRFMNGNVDALTLNFPIKLIDGKVELYKHVCRDECDFNKFRVALNNERENGSLSSIMFAYHRELCAQRQVPLACEMEAIYETCKKLKENVYGVLNNNPPIMGINFSDIAGYLRDFMDRLLIRAVLNMSSPPHTEIVMQTLSAGFFPLMWRGKWPNGYFLAWCPPGRSSELPPSCRPTQEQLALGDYKPPKRKPIDTAIFPVPTDPVVDPVTWKDLVHLPASEAFQRHFGPVVRTELGRHWFGKILNRVKSVSIGGSARKPELHFAFRSITVPDLLNPRPNVFVETEYSIQCQPPYTGDLTGVPIGIAPMLRRHNGITDGSRGRLWWLPWSEKTGYKRIEWSFYYPPDNEDGLFKKQPIAVQL